MLWGGEGGGGNSRFQVTGVIEGFFRGVEIFDSGIFLVSISFTWGFFASEWTLIELSFNMIENILCLGFISLYLRFCYVIFTRGILSTPACEFVICGLKTTCAAIELRKRLLTISKINITRWNMHRDNNFHSRRQVLRVSVSENH